MKLPKNLDPFYPPYGQFQTDTIGFGVIKDNPGILLPVGCGKTYCSINICKWRMENEGVEKILVLCPTSIMLKWQDEILKFSGSTSIILHHPTRQKRVDLIEQFKYSNIPFGIINYEALYPYYGHLSELNLDIIVADESARYIKKLVTGKIKPDGTSNYVKRTAAAVWLGDRVKHRMILTGTLITNKPLDIWAQFRFLNSKVFGDNYYRWRNFYFEKVKYIFFARWEIRRERMHLLTEKIYENCIRYEKHEIIKDLPETMMVEIPIKMNRELEEIYNEVKSKIIAEVEVEGGMAKLNIQHIFTKLLRLQQVTSGFVKDEDGEIQNLKETPKLDALMDEIYSIVDAEESGIIWCRFRYTIFLIEKMLNRMNIENIVLTGSDTPKAKGEKWRIFQKSKTINIFLGQVEAGGIGIELFKLDSEEEYQHVFFVENTYVLDHREQAIGRNEQRIGQNAKCRIVDFIVKDTIDERILGTLASNKQIADEIMRDGVTKWLE